MVEKKLGIHLTSYQRIVFRPMILIMGQTFVNLSPRNVIDAGTSNDQTDHV